MNEDIRKQLKQRAVRAARDWIEDRYLPQHEMTIGVGSGSTVSYIIPFLAELSGLTAVPTSDRTRRKLEEHNVNITEMDEAGRLLFDIDGADEVDPRLNLLKGGWGCQTREKQLANAAQSLLIVVDKTKLVDYLGQNTPLPVEVRNEKLEQAKDELNSLGSIEVRSEGGELFLTDNHNLVLDISLEKSYQENQLTELEEDINEVEGVIDNGIFARRAADTVFVGREERTDILRRS